MHFDGAHAALRNGDQDRASVEYKAFLADAIHRIANARANAGDWDIAGQNFQEALSFAQDDPTLRLDYASFLFDRGEAAEARPIAQSVLDQDPGNARGQILLGRLSFEEKQYSEAIRLLSAAGESHLREVWDLLALSYLRTQQPDLAQALIERALRILGEDPSHRVLMATIYYYGDYPDLAIKELRQALAADPDAPDAHYYLGLAYLSYNEAAGYTDAVHEFEAQLKLTPHDFRSHYMLGYIALQQHETKQAEREALEAKRDNPLDEGTILLLAQLYSETERRDEAMNALRSLTSRPATESEASFITIRAHYMLGRLLQQSGHIAEGVQEISIAENLRRRLRGGNAEMYSRTSVITFQQPNSPASSSRREATIGPEEQARANTFVNQLAPLVGEAYFNLARISAIHQDQAIAARYSAKAAAWDPSLASRAGQR